ncbi:hypothetical protein [Flaviaesturariibacter amylovorans]|uniref:Uncharacterized protein n=1 Tax=Flaviaesturariibacter amylovorans TaxID=1084520 RepID=A0ABP8HMJ4_9BACT
MKFRAFLLLPFIAACRSEEKLPFDYDTPIAATVYSAQMKYLDNTLSNYSRITDTGRDLYDRSLVLDSVAQVFKGRLKQGGKIAPEELAAFYAPYEGLFVGNDLINADAFRELKALPVRTASDVDLLRLYVKNNFVCILLNNKLLPYNTWSTMAAAARWKVGPGESFKVALAPTAWSSARPHEWFLVHDVEAPLSKANIIDTLTPDNMGTVHFDTTTLAKGEHVLHFLCRMTATGASEQVLSRSVTFVVE